MFIDSGVSARRETRLRQYGYELTAEINRKGVLDIDTVKGCTAGMAARPDGGCYNACYAAKCAKRRGIDFSKSVTRGVCGVSHAMKIERAAKNAPHGFFRVGTMGDPSHDWPATVEVAEWLSPYAVPVIVTKHWGRATDAQLLRLVLCGAVLNTSISALDTAQELTHRERQLWRYRAIGGVSVARIVSCDFNEANEEGARLGKIQDKLFLHRNVIDNPLRIDASHRLVTRGVVRVKPVRDLVATRLVSVYRNDVYLGHCSKCPDKCGLSSRPAQSQKPRARQAALFQ